MEYHQRSPIGNGAIMKYMTDWFRMPTSFDATLILSQILQALAMTYAVEHWRRSMPRGMGTLLLATQRLLAGGQLGRDRQQRPLEGPTSRSSALFCPPPGVGGGRQCGSDHGRASDQRPCRIRGLRNNWQLTTADGALLAEGKKITRISSMTNRQVMKINCAKQFAEFGPRNLLFWAQASVDGHSAQSANGCLQ